MATEKEQLAELIELQEATLRILAANFVAECKTSSEAAVVLSRVGLDNQRITSLLGVSYDSVRMAVSRAKKANTQK